jgi:hypothetical protein
VQTTDPTCAQCGCLRFGGVIVAWAAASLIGGYPRLAARCGAALFGIVGVRALLPSRAKERSVRVGAGRGRSRAGRGNEGGRRGSGWHDVSRGLYGVG